MTASSDLERYYARRAPEYDRNYEKPERQEDLAELRTWLAEAVRGLDVVEIACGTGYWTHVAARTATSVVATDVNAEVLDLARGRLDGLDHVRLEIEDLWADPDGPPRATAGLAGFFWSHVPRRRLHDFLRAFHARLRPGAVAVLFDNRQVPGSSTPLSHTDRHGDSWQRRRLEDGSEHDVIKNFPEEAEIREALAGSATEVRYRALMYYWWVEYRVAKEGGT